MQEENVSKLSLVGLNKNRMKLKGFIISAGIICTILIGTIVYIAYMKGKYAIPFLPIIIAIAIIFLPIFNNFDQVSIELKSFNLI